MESRRFVWSGEWKVRFFFGKVGLSWYHLFGGLQLFFLKNTKSKPTKDYTNKNQQKPMETNRKAKPKRITHHFGAPKKNNTRGPWLIFVLWQGGIGAFWFKHQLKKDPPCEQNLNVWWQSLLTNHLKTH